MKKILTLAILPLSVASCGCSSNAKMEYNVSNGSTKSTSTSSASIHATFEFTYYNLDDGIDLGGASNFEIEMKVFGHELTSYWSRDVSWDNVVFETEVQLAEVQCAQDSGDWVENSIAYQGPGEKMFDNKLWSVNWVESTTTCQDAVEVNLVDDMKLEIEWEVSYLFQDEEFVHQGN